MLIKIPDFLVNYLGSIIYSQSFYSTFIALIIVAPITEELLFRGVILSGLSSKYGIRKAVILTSVLFGLFHLNPVQIIGAIFVGLVLGWMKLKFDSIMVPIVFHGIYNALPLIFGRILKIDIQGYSRLDINPVLQPAWFDALGILFTIIGLFLLHRLSKRKKHKSESVTE
jgi:membrane protease YdiL (CAAX protease family)